MDPVTASLTGGSMVANLLSGAEERSAAHHAAGNAMQFSERMSSTAVQRFADDLEAAGFNRVLAAGGGSASTPPGITAEVKNLAEGAMTNALDIQRLKNENELLESNKILNTEKAQTQAAVQLLIDKQRQNLSANTSKTEFENVINKNRAELEKSFPGLRPVLELLKLIAD